MFTAGSAKVRCLIHTSQPDVCSLGRRVLSQAQELPSSADFWLGERGEPLAPPQHPRTAPGPDGVPSDEVGFVASS